MKYRIRYGIVNENDYEIEACDREIEASSEEEALEVANEEALLNVWWRAEPIEGADTA